MNNQQAILFAGAKSVNELYNDTFCYNIKEKTWNKLNPTGQIPSARAAHAACAVENNNLLVFGGAKKNGGYSSNELYRLNISNEPSWSILTCKDVKPSRRYGHTLIYSKPIIILFGGIVKDNNKLTNEIWTLNVEGLLQTSDGKNDLDKNITENKYYVWRLLNFEIGRSIPRPRIYHTCGICKMGKAKGMITVFGGRDEKGHAMNDLWGLRKHRNGEWEWVMAPYDKSTIPLRRYQHSSIFYANFMILLGGRGDLNEDYFSNGMPVEIFNTQSLQWFYYSNYDRFRHSSFCVEKFGYSQGGCSYAKPSEPSDTMEMFDVQELCYNTRYIT